jgi:hypothetical protein
MCHTDNLDNYVYIYTKHKNSVHKVEVFGYMKFRHIFTIKITFLLLTQILIEVKFLQVLVL